jgi:Holliday junction DNA helicase RuvA
MIGRVSGEVIERVDLQHHALITVSISGLGIEVLTPRSDVELITRGSRVELFTDFVLRDEAVTLYGFATAARRSLFRMLQTVTGVGPKVALTALGATETDELIAAIVDGDHRFLERIPGIGKKVASRISLELREKMALSSDGSQRKAHGDVFSALVNLGYGEREAQEAVRGIAADLEVDLALKEALSRLNRAER